MEQFLLKKVRRNKTRQTKSGMLKIIHRKEIWQEPFMKESQNSRMDWMMRSEQKFCMMFMQQMFIRMETEKMNRAEYFIGCLIR